jgi:hypothetical protein
MDALRGRRVGTLGLYTLRNGLRRHLCCSRVAQQVARDYAHPIWRRDEAKVAAMTFEHGHEVYVFFEGVFTLDSAVDAQKNEWVTLRTPTGARIDLPIEAVAEWDVHTPVRPDGQLRPA